jgi:hypothetical protein
MSLVVAGNSPGILQQATWLDQAPLPPQVWQRLQQGPRPLTLAEAQANDRYGYFTSMAEVLMGSGAPLAEALGMCALRDPAHWDLSTCTQQQFDLAYTNYYRLLNPWAPSVTGDNLFRLVAADELVSPAAMPQLRALCDLLVSGLQHPEGVGLMQVVEAAEAVKALL